VAGLIVSAMENRRGYKTEAHHPDYMRPFEVVWLCAKHHSDIGWKEKAGSCIHAEHVYNDYRQTGRYDDTRIGQVKGVEYCIFGGCYCEDAVVKDGNKAKPCGKMNDCAKRYYDQIHKVVVYRQNESKVAAVPVRTLNEAESSFVMRENRFYC
jgi:hypothetical protein